ncbi:MAG TPA: diguanylate cyclase [Desulfurobacteriaceae bacterium]|nr:diguanylate cyclase [Desulfurobacteriaceae bacterium]
MDFSRPIEIAEDIFWVGYIVPNDPFQCHAYVIRNKDESILIDPGSMITFPVVLEKIYKVVDLKDIKYVIMHHQDPDITGCYSTLESIMPYRDDRRIVTHWRTQALLKHYMWKTPFYLIDKHDWKLKAGDRELEFIFTPYAHFPGAFCTLDKKTKTLFSSDIFGAISDTFKFYADKSKEYLEGLFLFHKHYMPSKAILNYALKQIEEAKPKLIAPQHGSIIKEDLIDYVISKLKELECGLFFFESKESDIVLLNKTENILKKFFEDALINTHFEKVLENLFKYIKNEIPSLKEIVVISKFPNTKDSLIFKVDDKGVTKKICDSVREFKNYKVSYLLKAQDQKVGDIYIYAQELTPTQKKFLDILFKKISSPLAISLKKNLDYLFLEKTKNELYEKATKDNLTQVYNRSYLWNYLKSKIEEYRHNPYPLSLAILDIDFFKKINDTYGHLVGDEALKELAQLLKESLPPSFVVARYGGEEFVVVMPFTDIDKAYEYMENIRKKVENRKFTSKNINITVRIGVAQYKDGMSLQDFLFEADKKLYTAKKLGRNRVVK